MLLLHKDWLITNRVKREFNRFYFRIIHMEKERIIERCNQIHFYYCVQEYFEYNERVSDEALSFLFKKKDIIHSMWDYYIKYEELECSTWTQIEEIIAVWMANSLCSPMLQEV